MTELKLIGITSENRRVYQIPKLVIRGRKIEVLIIDPHFEKRHSYMTDEKIYYLVKKYLPYNEPKSAKKEGLWECLVWEPLVYENKVHRLIACFHEKEVDFLGIVHCYRIKKSKYEKEN